MKPGAVVGMGTMIRIFGVLCALLLCSSAIAQTGCDRGCLLNGLNDYEAHVLKHDVTGVVTSADFRGTENYKPTALGQGYFTCVRQIFHQEQFADPVDGQVAAIGLLDDGGRDAYFVLRLKINTDHSIAQSEMLLIHDGETSFLQKNRNVKLSPIYTQIVPVGLRSSRDQMIADADNFTDAWQYKDASLAQFSADCTFSENNLMLSLPGYTTCGDMLEYMGRRGVPGAGTSPERGNAGDPIRPMTPADPSIGRPPLQGPWIRDRRVLVVDVEHGVVVAWHIQGGEPARPGETIQYARKTQFLPTSEDHRRTAAENAQMGKARAGGGAPGGPPREMGAAYMAGIFKIVGGKLVKIDHFEWEGGPNASGGFADGPKF